MDDDLTYFLELRVRLRGRPKAIAIIDRCLRMLADAEQASPQTIARLERERAALQAELVALFGQKGPVRVH